MHTHIHTHTHTILHYTTLHYTLLVDSIISVYCYVVIASERSEVGVQSSQSSEGEEDAEQGEGTVSHELTAVAIV